MNYPNIIAIIIEIIVLIFIIYKIKKCCVKDKPKWQ
jgi:hypothetical protein